MHRTQFSKLVQQIRDGEVLAVSKLDRLGRDALDICSTIKFLSGRDICVIVLQRGNLDLTSAVGKMMLTMLAAISEIERDLLIERTEAGLVRARKEGKILGRPKRTTPEQRKEILQRYEQGISVGALSRLYLVSRATIARIAKPSKNLPKRVC